MLNIKKRNSSFVLLGAFLTSLLLAACSHQSLKTKTESVTKTEKPNYLFVQSIYAGKFNGKELSLDKISAQTLYFSDRPARKVGHIPTAHFMKLWSEGSDSFKSDPPNATLSITTKDKIANAVIELMNPRLKGTKFVYDVKVIEGVIPKKFESASLFIDAASADIVMTGGGPGQSSTPFDFGLGN